MRGPSSRSACFRSWTKRRRIRFFKERPGCVGWRAPRRAERHELLREFHVVIRDVWRFEQEDTLILGGAGERSDAPSIQAELGVRLEDRIYTQSLADASGIMPPKSTTPAFFAITGNGRSARQPSSRQQMERALVRANAAPRTSNESAPNLDGASKSRREGSFFSYWWGDLRVLPWPPHRR